MIRFRAENIRSGRKKKKTIKKKYQTGKSKSRKQKYIFKKIVAMLEVRECRMGYDKCRNNYFY